MIAQPSDIVCKRVYRWIQAHCMIRVSTRIGDQLRGIAGVGSVTTVPVTILQTKFSGSELQEAQRLVALAIHNSKKKEANGQDSLPTN